MNEALMANHITLLSGSSNPKLAKDVGSKLGLDVLYPVTKFADSEIRVVIPKNLRRSHVFIIQPTFPLVNDSLMELLLMIDAAKRASVNEITAVVPYFGYSRQDRKDRPRVPISSSLIVNMLKSAGVNRVVTVDIHSEQQQGFFDGPWDNLYGSFCFVPEIKKKKLKNLIIASPDKGGVSKAVYYAKILKAAGIAIVYKERDVSTMNQSEALDMIGNVQGKDVLIVDDMIDTAGTLTNAANLIFKRGARSVRAAATHGLFSPPALERINDSAIKELFITDTVLAKEEVLKNKKIKIITIAPLLAEAIKRIQSGESISEGLIL